MSNGNSFGNGASVCPGDGLDPRTRHHGVDLAAHDRESAMSGPGLRLHPRTMHVQGASAEISLKLIKLQQEHDLTDVEMLRVLHECAYAITTRLLRAERHPDEPDRKADEA